VSSVPSTSLVVGLRPANSPRRSPSNCVVTSATAPLRKRYWLHDGREGFWADRGGFSSDEAAADEYGLAMVEDGEEWNDQDE
jgi:hypothetical protein